MSKPVWMKDYGLITVIKENLRVTPYGNMDPITLEPLTFKDICPNCRNEISKFILNNLYIEENPEIEIKYDGEIIKEVKNDE